MATNGDLNRKLRMALVGGGQGSFIGRVHCTAAVLDKRAVLAAGALSSDPERARASAPDYDIPDDRAYGSYAELIESESGLPEDERVDFIYEKQRKGIRYRAGTPTKEKERRKEREPRSVADPVLF